VATYKLTTYFIPTTMDLTTHIYTSRDELPEKLIEGNLFHGRRLFGISRLTPRHRPYMVTVEDEEGTVHAQLLAMLRYRSTWLPPYFYMHCRVFGEGVYLPQYNSTNAHSEAKEELFSMMLKALTKRLGNRVLYMEVSNLSHKMFGYKAFRESHFFPVRWMNIHNSLHSRAPEERISERMKKHLSNAQAKGVTVSEVSDEATFRAFMKLLRKHNFLKPKRYLPPNEFFRQFMQQEAIDGEPCGRLFVTRYKHYVIGCAAVAYSGREAYLWYSAFRRKSFALLHPDEVTIWNILKNAHTRGYNHLSFMDVGLPFRKNSFREFILRFGGKPTSTYRWFRCSIRWINNALSWFYRD